MRPGSALPLLACLLGSFPGCGVPFPAYRPVGGERLEEQLSLRFVVLPDAAKMTIRAIVTLDGMELPLTLRDLRKHPDRLRVLGMDDLGGTLFHFVRSAGRTVVISRARALPETFVVDGLGPNLSLWLFAGRRGGGTPGDPPGGGTRGDPQGGTPSDRIVQTADGADALLRRDGDTLTLYWSSTEAGPIDHIAAGSGGRLHAEIHMTWEGGRPVAAEITDHRGGYEVDLEVSRWDPAELSETQFQTDR